eukprot:4201021-Pyramimonas_sp.AAC.2
MRVVFGLEQATLLCTDIAFVGGEGLSWLPATGAEQHAKHRAVGKGLKDHGQDFRWHRVVVDLGGGGVGLSRGVLCPTYCMPPFTTLLIRLVSPTALGIVALRLT